MNWPVRDICTNLELSCAASSVTSDRASAATCFLRGCSDSNTAGTTQQGSPSSRTGRSTRSTRWATFSTSATRWCSKNGHLRGSTGIGHTRWATHGRVTEANAHPHWDTSERVHIVLNGIVENWTELREQLLADGAKFTSETDAEVVAHLVAQHFEGDLVEAVRRAYNDLRGHYAFVAMSADAAGSARGRPQGVPAGGGSRRGRGLHRLGDPGLPGRDPPRAARRERRDRRRDSGGHPLHRRRGRDDRARHRRGRLGRGHRREERV